MSDHPAATPSTLDVLETLLGALDDDVMLDAWTITRQTRRTGANVIAVIDRLEDAGWLTATWEADAPAGQARRRLYRLKANAVTAAAAMVRRSAKRAQRFELRHPGLAQTATG